VDASQEVRDRIERLGRPLEAIVHVLPSPSAFPEGPLRGLPVGVKDMIDVAGSPRGNGNPEDMAGAPREHDAEVVRDLRALGADIAALTSLLEYAAGAQHPGLPEARNPRAPHLTAGGSSGGSAALVGSGAVPIALGTDTGGSIRLPAHYCGVVGFKPTYGTFSVEGVQPLSPTLDHVGLLGIDVPTTIRVFEALTRIQVPLDSTRLTIGLLRGQFDDPRLDDEIRQVVESAVARVAPHVTIVDVDSAALERLNGVIGDIIAFEAWQVHGATVSSRPEHYGEPTGRLFAAAEGVSVDDYEAALREREALLPAAAALLDGVDVLLGPAGPYVAPEISPPGDTPEGAIEGIFTGPYNVTGQPALVLPCGTTDEGLPVGLQIAARRDDDAGLLAAARSLEILLTSPE
jgi:aspartyl-tRNA(Asn)/glutamyl-tRNA(Gln) amidotransferase subunit A